MKHLNKIPRHLWYKAYRQYRINGRCQYALVPLCANAILGAKVVYFSNVRDYLTTPYLDRKKLIKTEIGVFYNDRYGLVSKLFYY